MINAHTRTEYKNNLGIDFALCFIFMYFRITQHDSKFYF